MKKAVVFLILGFTLGFFAHALFTPDLFANGIFIIPQAPQITPGALQQAVDSTAPIETKITFDGSNFSRTNINVERSRYISITNESEDTKMDLSSNESDLVTPRPYAYKEQIRTRIDKPGQYVVADRNNPSVRMVITVK
ncbi:hypothetical protein BH09PAT1_BH09PAT1_8770 [soil metagenome]